MRCPRAPEARGCGCAARRRAGRPARPGRCRGRAGRRARRAPARPPSGPESSAALERVSASTAVSPRAVAPISPVQAGSPRRGVEQVVGVAAVVAAPDPHVEARRSRRAPEPSLQHVGALAGQRVLDEDLVGVDERVGAADPDVAAAVDDEARVAAQPLGDQVGGEALAGAAGVEADAGRAGDRPGRVVDLEAAPARRRVGARRAPRRRLGERGAQRRAGHPGPRGDVAGGLDLADQGRVDQAAAALRRPEAGLDRRRAAAPRRGRARAGRRSARTARCRA